MGYHYHYHHYNTLLYNMST